MAVITDFSASRLRRLLGHYDVGDLVRFVGLPEGSVQTNLRVETTRGQFVFRYYEDRLWPRGRAEAEAEILAYLTEAHFPCPAPIPRRDGAYVGTHHGRPYSLFTLLEGEHVDPLSPAQVEQVAGMMAELHLITEGYRPRRTARRNYSVASCARDARQRAAREGTPEAAVQLEWRRAVLNRLVLPRALPKGVCHGDLNPTNLLFREGRLAALLDWDDANYTYLIFELANLLGWHCCWPDGGEFPFAQARRMLRAYEARRALRAVERRHLYDVYQLWMLFDCWWWSCWGPRPDFSRPDFADKRKLEALEAIGREGFSERMFG